MLLAVAMLALAWAVPLTVARRVVPSESVIALCATGALVSALYLLGRLA